MKVFKYLNLSCGGHQSLQAGFDEKFWKLPFPLNKKQCDSSDGENEIKVTKMKCNRDPEAPRSSLHHCVAGGGDVHELCQRGEKTDVHLGRWK